MDDPADTPFLYVAAAPYGGQAGVGFFRSVLELRAACAARSVALQLDLAGGEALAARGQAMQMARFLATSATHLLLTDGQWAFSPEVVLAELSGAEVRLAHPHRLLARAAVTAALEDAPQGRFADVRGAAGAAAGLLFESRIDPVTRRYRPGGLLTGDVE